MKKLVFVLTTVVALAFSQTSKAQGTIVDAAVGNENFSTLVAALKAADLVGALQGDGPFTVFAPTNDAFAKIDKATLGSLLKPENKETLTKILTYHVIPGKLTLAGEKLTVMKKDGKIWLKDQAGNYSEITATDVAGSNGVIHVIDTVVMPK